MPTHALLLELCPPTSRIFVWEHVPITDNAVFTPYQHQHLSLMDECATPAWHGMNWCIMKRVKGEL